MPDIYEQHRAAFARFEAFVILKDGERVATVAFKFPADGAGRLYAYVHWLGCEMVRGYAGGGGYDKRSAAVADAVRKMGADYPHDERRSPVERMHREAFRQLLLRDNGTGWDRQLKSESFEVLQAA